MNPATQEDVSLNRILEGIGKKLSELGFKKGYTSHADFADDHDLPRIQYWRMEKGKTNITLRSLQRVLTIHGLTIEEIFTNVGNENSTRKKRKNSREKAA